MPSNFQQSSSQNKSVIVEVVNKGVSKSACPLVQSVLTTEYGQVCKVL